MRQSLQNVSNIFGEWIKQGLVLYPQKIESRIDHVQEPYGSVQIWFLEHLILGKAIDVQLLMVARDEDRREAEGDKNGAES